MSKRGLLSVRTNLILIGIVLCAIAFVVIFSYATYSPASEPTFPDDNTSEPIVPITPEPNVTFPDIPDVVPGVPHGGGTTTSNSSSPRLTIDSPSNGSVIGTTNVTLQYSIRRFSAQTCWYVLDDGDRIMLNDCGSSTFNASLGAHVIDVYANNSNDSVISDHSEFNVVPGLPSIALTAPSANYYLNISAVTFSYIPQHASLESCSLYGNFNGDYRKVQSSSAVVNGTINSFTQPLADGTYLWAIECTTTQGGKSITDNRTLTVDTVPPSVSIQQPVGVQSSMSMVLRMTASDAYLGACIYGIFNSTGAFIGPFDLHERLIPGCDQANISVPSSGSYMVQVMAYDRAGNTALNTSAFSVNASLLLLNYPLSIINGITTPDTSVYKRNGSASFTQIVSQSPFGNVMQFGLNNVSSYVAGPSINLGRAFTLSAWVKLTSLPSSLETYRIIDKSWVGTNYASYSLLVNGSGHLIGRTRAQNLDPSFDVVSPQPLQVGTWYLINLVSVDNGQSMTLDLYVNAAKIASLSSVASSPYANNVPTTIGGQSTSAAPYSVHNFRGYMHDIRIYGRSLSQSEITALSQGVDIRFGPPGKLFSTWALISLGILTVILIVLVVMLFISLKRDKNKKNGQQQNQQGPHPPMPPYAPYRPGYRPNINASRPLPPRPVRPIQQPIIKK